MAAPFERPPFCIGHDDRLRNYEITEDVLDHARSLGYNLLTLPITTRSYQQRVLEQLSPHCKKADELFLALPYPTLDPLTKEDVNIAPNDTIQQLLVTTSTWISLASPDPLLADISRQAFCQEVSYAAFCGAADIVIEGPKFWPGLSTTDVSKGTTQFARAIKQALTLGVYVRIQIRLPMAYGLLADANLLEPGHLDSPGFSNLTVDRSSPHFFDGFDSWDVWNVVRQICDYSPRLSLALILPAQLPPPAVADRWMSEPLRVLDLPGSIFMKNKHHIHVLPRAHQQLIMKYMCLQTQPWILLSDVGPLPGFNPPGSTRISEFNSSSDGLNSDMYTTSGILQDPTPAEASVKDQSQMQSAKTAQPYIEYIRKHLQGRMPVKTAVERFGSGYQDYLQNPLQPLTDNLESITYEVFEKDPVKYTWYEHAVEAALKDWVRQGKPASGPDGLVTIAVVGAGRGPLVSRALEASRKANVPIRLWALEKNPSAFVLLQRRNEREWSGRVTLVQSDMRRWQGPQMEHKLRGMSTKMNSRSILKIDILISELLGSFGDNELSPECLDGVQRLLNPTHGLSIPKSYTAFVTPIAAPKLHADIRMRESGGDPDASMIPYVVMLQAFDFLSTTNTASKPMTENPSLDPVVKRVWDFEHPIAPEILVSAAAGTNTHNRRSTRLVFSCPNRGVCHGLAGYFEALLYSNEPTTNGNNDQARFTPGAIELSTNPVTMDQKSRDMISWFPIYFPLKTPLYFPDQSELAVSMWRQTDGRKVWYEWMVEAFMVVEQQNRNSRVRIGGTGLHSSINNGCLI